MGPWLLFGLILLLPLAGTMVGPQSTLPILRFPPLVTTPGQPSFSWGLFLFSTLLILAVLTPFINRYVSHQSVAPPSSLSRSRFPWWGWVALAWTTGSWAVAWTRLPWFASFQPYTFPFLWFGYIASMNALMMARTGSCLLVHHTSWFLKLFPLSAAVWWLYEYLNLFVKNWHYVNLPDDPSLFQIAWASLAFSTVLPAIWSTTEFLETFPRMKNPFHLWHSIQRIPRQIGILLLGLGCLGLFLIGIWPHYLYPMLWLSPLFLMMGYKQCRNESNIFSDLTHGNWTSLVLPGLAGLICGFWWEMWNARSLTHWEYTIPFLHGYTIFEMPLLGYAGYLPFGLECLLITELVLGNKVNPQTRP